MGDVDDGNVTARPYGPVRSITIMSGFVTLVLTIPDVSVQFTWIASAAYVASPNKNELYDKSCIVHVLPLSSEYFQETASA